MKGNTATPVKSPAPKKTTASSSAASSAASSGKEEVLDSKANVPYKEAESEVSLSLFSFLCLLFLV